MATISTKLLFSLFAQCASGVAPETLHTIIEVESGRNPYAIAIVYDKSVPASKRLYYKQAKNEREAKNIIKYLESHQKFHKSYSVGLMQVNSVNFNRYGINLNNMFDACKNIEAGAEIFKSCYIRAKSNNPTKSEQELLRIASSCYYSGNEKTGFKKERHIKNSSYVDRINAAVNKNYIVPAIEPMNSSPVSSSNSIKSTYRIKENPQTLIISKTNSSASVKPLQSKKVKQELISRKDISKDMFGGLP